MKGEIAIVVVSVLALTASSQEGGPADRAEADEPRPLTVRDTVREPEEVIVRSYEWQPGSVPSAETMQQVYDLRGRGACLYKKGRYAESFPYLQAAARKGFKLAQARLAFLYQQGLGTKPDPYKAIAWYGVAATGTTLPEIRSGFRKVWRGIPDDYRPTVSALVDEYKRKYGASRHRVGCDLSYRAGTYIKKLTCRFRDAGAYVDHGPLFQALLAQQEGLDATPAINEVEATGVMDNPFPTSTPLRTGSFGC